MPMVMRIILISNFIQSVSEASNAMSGVVFAPFLSGRDWIPEVFVVDLTELSS